MNIAIVINSAMMRSILSDIFTENNDIVLFTGANWKAAIEICKTQHIDIIVFGDNTFNVDEDYFYLELSSINYDADVVFTGKYSIAEIEKLTKRGYHSPMPYPDIEKIYDTDYRKSVFEWFHKGVDDTSFDVLNIKNEFKEKYKMSGGFSGRNSGNKIELIVIGSSTGGPRALKTILDGLPADFPVPISIVQHLEDGHEDGLVKYLGRDCKLKIRLAVDNYTPVVGEVIIAVQGKHLIVRNNKFFYIDGEKVNFQKPAIDVLFKTASDCYKKKVVGVLLTGMGQDGARGCVDIIRNGGYTIVQDSETSTVFGMPKAAIEMDGASIVLPIDKIGDYLVDITMGKGNYDSK